MPRASGDTVHPQGRGHEDGTKKTTFPPIGIVAHRPFRTWACGTDREEGVTLRSRCQTPSNSCRSGSRDAIVPLVGDGRALDN